MKKRVVLAIMTVAMSMSMSAQVQFDNITQMIPPVSLK